MVLLVTGTSLNGIGFEASRAIAKYASLVVITGYNEERLQLSKDAIVKAVPAANIRTLMLNLSSLAAVRKAAAEVNAYAEPIHVLINNAAATAGVYALSVDNIEAQMAAGHIGPFLFTQLLMPKMLTGSASSETPRVLFLTSTMHSVTPVLALDDLDAEEFLRGHGGPKGSDPASTLLDRYGQVKAANVMTAKELARRGAGKVLAYAVHPGTIWTNAFAGGFREEMKRLGLIGDDGNASKEYPDWKTIGQGAATTVVGAFDPRLSEYSGAYLADCAVAEDQVAPHCADETRAAKLWKMTEDAVGQAFNL
ncbi:Short-chain dehydrogenase/reductase family protein [Mycena chlorophos]|uniref:Short-chain dehydrogenase/reductase family protein n=1 Tax=Mycena chlorophos TaxID=658473 RepID=A0A8H6SKA9_MYCCL|nr:Short-chain dehydrogenase/reductase family protein [Mycena chlorophos]